MKKIAEFCSTKLDQIARLLKTGQNTSWYRGQQLAYSVILDELTKLPELQYPIPVPVSSEAVKEESLACLVRKHHLCFGSMWRRKDDVLGLALYDETGLLKYEAWEKTWEANEILAKVYLQGLDDSKGGERK